MLNESKQPWRMVFRDVFARSDDTPIESDLLIGSGWHDESCEPDLTDMSADRHDADEAAQRWQAECAIGATQDAVALNEAEALNIWQSVCQRVNQHSTDRENTQGVRRRRFLSVSWPFALAATLLVGMALPTLGRWFYREAIGSIAMPSALTQPAGLVELPAAARAEPVAVGMAPTVERTGRHAPKVRSVTKKDEPIGLLMASYKSDGRQSSVPDELVTARYEGSKW